MRSSHDTARTPRTPRGLRSGPPLGFVVRVTSAAKKKKATVPAADMRDPVRRALDAAPFDDEPVTTADKRAIARARRGLYVSTEEVRRKLGL